MLEGRISSGEGGGIFREENKDLKKGGGGEHQAVGTLYAPDLNT